MSEGEESVLREWLGVVSRQRWLVLAAVLITPVLAFAVSHGQQRIYQGTAEVLVSEQTPSALVLNATSSVTSPPDRYAATQAGLARVATVAKMAVKASGVRHRSAAGLLAHSSVSSDPTTDLLTFSVSDSLPGYAQRLADSYAAQFTVYRQRLDTAALTSAIADTRHKLNTVAAAGGSHSAFYLQLKANERDLEALQTIQRAGSGAVVVNRSDGASQVGPKTKRNIILGLLVGLALGLLAAFLRESLDTRANSAEELEERLGMPLLGEVPALGWPRTDTDRPATLLQPTAAKAAFTLAAGNLEIARNQHDVQSILVTSIDEEEDKSQAAANLAVALARMGRRVVLLDLDLVHPGIERLFGLVGRPGLGNLAAGNEYEKALNVVDVREEGDQSSPSGAKLEVMTVGTARPLPVQFLWSSTVLDALAALSGRCDVLLINGPPLARGGDALWIASYYAEGLLLVASVHTRRAQVSEAHRSLEASPARALGLVATRDAMDLSRLRSVLTPALRGDAGKKRRSETPGSPKSDDSGKREGPRRPTLVERGFAVALKRTNGSSPPGDR